MAILDFEKPVVELEQKIEELRQMPSAEAVDLDDEIGRLEAKVERLLKQIYGKLSPAQKVQVARHPNRPHFTDYAKALFDEFTPLGGDRSFGEDEAVIGGLARFDGLSVMVIGQEKGADTESRMRHNFGMARPEGYRKAQRLMRMAERFGLPIVTFVDTAGAYPGIEAEERGQAQAIAASIETCLDVSVPIICVVIGEGGSGGAIALAAGDRVLMLEHAIYSVISPEGCASILWRSAAAADEAAAALRLTAQDLQNLKVIDEVISEPLGGAHREPASVIEGVRTALAAAISQLRYKDKSSLRRNRQNRFLEMGQALPT